MSIVTELDQEPETGIESGENFAKPPLESINHGNAGTPDHEVAQLNRQYTPSDTLQLDNDLESSRKSYFRTLTGSFKFSTAPDLPRSNATADLLVTIFCFATVHFIYLGSLNFSSHRTIVLFSSLVFIILFLSAGGMYNTKSLRNLNGELKYLLLCWMCAFAAVGLFAFLTQTAQTVSRVWLTTSMVSSLVSLAGIRVLVVWRSMKLHSDSEVRQATRNDARVTRIGKVLRSTSLDESPQLLNVIGGTMSLVGPRPHAAAHNEIWRNQIEGYMLRHKVRPGITGWAQVNGWRGETDTAIKMQQRVKYDLDYIQNWSPWMDVKIVLSTIILLFRDENAY